MRTSRFLSLYYVVHLKLYIRLSPIVRLKLSRQKIQIKKISCRQLDKHKSMRFGQQTCFQPKGAKRGKNNKRFLCFVRLDTLIMVCCVGETHILIWLFISSGSRTTLSVDPNRFHREVERGRWTGPHTHTHTFVARDFLLAESQVEPVSTDIHTI